MHVVLDEVGDLGDKLEQVNLEDSEPEAYYIHIDIVYGNKEKRDQRYIEGQINRYMVIDCDAFDPREVDDFPSKGVDPDKLKSFTGEKRRRMAGVGRQTHEFWKVYSEKFSLDEFRAMVAGFPRGTEVKILLINNNNHHKQDFKSKQ